eukprot:3589620-Pleurochrysis_carterae.AAC.2
MPNAVSRAVSGLDRSLVRPGQMPSATSQRANCTSDLRFVHVEGPRKQSPTNGLVACLRDMMRKSFLSLRLRFFCRRGRLPFISNTRYWL